MRIDSNGNVGIGTTSLTQFNLRVSNTITGSTSSQAIRADGTVQSNVTSEAVYFNARPSTAAASFTLTDLVSYAVSQGTIGAGSAVTNQFAFKVDSSLTGATNNYGFYGNIASGTGRWNFYANGTAANYFAGTVQTGSTISVGGATPSTSGAGVTFPATQSGSSDANTLDDYEEGTWTPVITVGGGSITYTASGHYTKVGRMVTVTGTFLTSAASSPSGVPYITGLPFTIGYASAGSYSITNAFSASLGTQPIMLNMGASETRIRIAMQTSGDWGTFASYFNASCGFNFSATYFV
jgi:hypothetical protein